MWISSAASRKPQGILNEICVQNVLELSGFEDEIFDVVLCMGALYHLKEPDDRTLAVAQYNRVFIFSSFDEIVELAEEFSFEQAAHIGVCGMTYAISEKINNASEENFNQWLNDHFATCEEHSVLEARLHGLYIGRKPDSEK